MLISRDILCNMHESVADYVAEPQDGRVLFTALLLLTQAAPAAANQATSVAGGLSRAGSSFQIKSSLKKIGVFSRSRK